MVSKDPSKYKETHYEKTKMRRDMIKDFKD